MSNPLFDRLTHRQARTSDGTTALMVVVSIAVGCLLIVIEGGNFQYIWSGPQDLVMIAIAWSAIILAPVIITAIAAELTAYDVRSDLYKEMCFTPISNSSIVLGYFLATLWRIRIILILVGGALLPLVIAAMIRGRFLAGIDCTGNSDLYLPCSNPIVLSAGEKIAWAATYVGTGIGLWGINLLAGAIGVAAALYFHRPVLSIFAAGLLTILIELFFLYTVFGNTVWTTFILIAPYISGTLILFTARRWIR